MTDPAPTAPRTSRIAQLAAALAAASVTCVLVSVIGAQWELLTPLRSFGLFSVGALLGGALTLILAIVAIFITRGGQDRTGKRRAWSSVLVSVVLLGIVIASAAPGRNAPSINDITTNPGDPPVFLNAPQIPENQGRDMTYPKDFPAITRKFYPNLKSLEVNKPALAVLPGIIDAMRQAGWVVTSIDMKAGVVEATDTTPFFRFVDDIVVRIRSIGPNSTVLDIRSKSRDGKGDLGANAARIERFLYEFGRTEKQPR